MDWHGRSGTARSAPIFALAALLALAPVLVAMPAGARVAGHLSQQAFDRVILVLLVAMAVKLFADSGLFG